MWFRDYGKETFQTLDRQTWQQREFESPCAWSLVLFFNAILMVYSGISITIDLSAII